jgi:hypothetical protein
MIPSGSKSLYRLTIWQGGECIMARMTGAIALAHLQMLDLRSELMRSALVCCCALALIAAGMVLPF